MERNAASRSATNCGCACTTAPCGSLLLSASSVGAAPRTRSCAVVATSITARASSSACTRAATVSPPHDRFQRLPRAHTVQLLRHVHRSRAWRGAPVPLACPGQRICAPIHQLLRQLAQVGQGSLVQRGGASPASRSMRRHRAARRRQRWLGSSLPREVGQAPARHVHSTPRPGPAALARLPRCAPWPRLGAGSARSGRAGTMLDQLSRDRFFPAARCDVERGAALCVGAVDGQSAPHQQLHKLHTVGAGRAAPRRPPGTNTRPPRAAASCPARPALRGPHRVRSAVRST